MGDPLVVSRAALAQQAGGQPSAGIEKAAMVIAKAMDYPWEHMPEQGREHMRQSALKAINAARSAAKDK